jgi:glycosyltransferase involved in cell wall biosynthesis
MNNSLLYFTILNEESKSLGFLKKVRSQCIAFEKLGHSVFLGILRNTEFVIYRVVNSEFEKESCFHFGSRMASITNRASILKRVKNQQVLSKIMRFTQEWCEKKEIDAVYIRRFALSHLVIRFLRALSQQSKIVWEYPTFPWTSEYRHSHSLFRSIVERSFASLMERHVDLIVGVSGVTNFERKGVLLTTNGVGVDELSVRKPPYLHRTVELLGLGKITSYHGYDRIIKGIADYKGEYKVVFNIAGDGNEIENLRKLVHSLNVDESVKFHGVVDGKKLDDLFDKSHIGVGSLALHKIGGQYPSPLKHREFCARGLPFVHATDDPDFTGLEPYVKKVEHGEDPIDIDELVTMAIEIYNGREDGRRLLRDHAVKELDWAVKMKPISDFILEASHDSVKRTRS